MGETWACVKCKKTAPRYVIPRGWAHVYVAPGAEGALDYVLCPEHAAELRKWLDGTKLEDPIEEVQRYITDLFTMADAHAAMLASVEKRIQSLEANPHNWTYTVTCVAPEMTT